MTVSYGWQRGGVRLTRIAVPFMVTENQIRFVMEKLGVSEDRALVLIREAIENEASTHLGWFVVGVESQINDTGHPLPHKRPRVTLYHTDRLRDNGTVQDDDFDPHAAAWPSESIG